MKHTPGPWEYDPGDKNSDPVVVGSDCHEIAFIYKYRQDKSVTETNARLIAAAPELLEALELSEQAIQAAHRQTDAEWRKHDTIEEQCEKIITNFRKKRDAAINKARTG